MKFANPLSVVLVLSFALTATRTRGEADLKSSLRGVRSDVPYIQCETCTFVIEAAVNETNKMEQDRLTELALFDMVESLCNPNDPVGRWATTIDLQERLRKIHLVKQEATQECKQECRTIALACSQVLDSVETELAERLYLLRKQGPVDTKHVQSWFCDKSGLSSACAERTPLFPKSRPTGPPFVPRDEKQAAMDAMLKQMQGENNGLGINAMDPNAMPPPSEGDDDDDDDDNDDQGKTPDADSNQEIDDDAPDNENVADDAEQDKPPEELTRETDKDEI